MSWPTEAQQLAALAKYNIRPKRPRRANGNSPGVRTNEVKGVVIHDIAASAPGDSLPEQAMVELCAGITAGGTLTFRKMALYNYLTGRGKHPDVYMLEPKPTYHCFPNIKRGKIDANSANGTTMACSSIAQARRADIPPPVMSRQATTVAAMMDASEIGRGKRGAANAWQHKDLAPGNSDTFYSTRMWRGYIRRIRRARWQAPTDGPKRALRARHKGLRVAVVQLALDVPVTGVHDKRTRDAVRKFKKRNGYAKTGPRIGKRLYRECRRIVVNWT